MEIRFRILLRMIPSGRNKGRTVWTVYLVSGAWYYDSSESVKQQQQLVSEKERPGPSGSVLLLMENKIQTCCAVKDKARSVWSRLPLRIVALSFRSLRLWLVSPKDRLVRERDSPSANILSDKEIRIFETRFSGKLCVKYIIICDKSEWDFKKWVKMSKLNTHFLDNYE